MNLRTHDGQVFWPRADVPFAVNAEQPLHLTSHDERQLVTLWGREWLLKRKYQTLGEIGAYQLAEALKLPVLRWIAIYDAGPSHQQAVLLVEMWRARQFGTLAHPGILDRNLVGRALTLDALNRNETPEWLANEDQSDLRLFDLEYIGPHTHNRDLRNYTAREISEGVIGTAFELALRSGVTSSFISGLREALLLDLDAVIDFSGHPKGLLFKKRYVSGLRARLKAISAWLKHASIS